LGSRKATKKASAAIPAPKKLAITISLRKPKIRLRNVPIPIVVAAFVILWFSDMLSFGHSKTFSAGLSSSGLDFDHEGKDAYSTF
jgi:hypothetical protein